MTIDSQEKVPRWNILLAEDNHINQLVTKAQLQQLGCDVDIAADGLEAIQATKHQDFDLIIMDCNMPKVDGYEAALQIRAREKQLGKSQVPIIAFTADVIHSEEHDCEAVGMNGYLSKPIVLQDLKEILKDWLEHPAVKRLLPKTESNILKPLTPSIQSLDATALHEMQQKLPDVQVNRIISLFLNELPTYLKTLEHAIDSQNAEALYLSAHKFKGASIVLGGKRVVVLCNLLCDKGRHEIFDHTTELLEQLKTECVTLKSLLEEHLVTR